MDWTELLGLESLGRKVRERSGTRLKRGSKRKFNMCGARVQPSEILVYIPVELRHVWLDGSGTYFSHSFTLSVDECSHLQTINYLNYPVSSSIDTTANCPNTSTSENKFRVIVACRSGTTYQRQPRSGNFSRVGTPIEDISTFSRPHEQRNSS